MTLPKINARYVAGPLDEVVYRAAEAAEMPSVVVSVYDGGQFTWRWRLSAGSGPEVGEVVLSIGPRATGGFVARVGVETSRPSPSPRRSRWQLVGQVSVPSVSALDETWLTEQLRNARDKATER